MSFINGSYLHLTENTPTNRVTYSAATDWVSITGVPDNQIIFLVSDATISKYTIRTQFTRPGSENIYIDWGDGIVDTISTTSATDSDHTYTSGGTSCSRGYNTWKITISGDSGTRITECRIIQPSTEYSETPCGLLQAWYGDNTVTTMNQYFSEQNGSITTPWFPYLEYVKIPDGLTAADSLVYTFVNGCRALQKVDMPTSLSAITSLQYTFYECNALYDLGDFPNDMTQVNSLEQTWYNCYSLEEIVLPPVLSAVTRCDRAWQNNYSLGYFNLPEMPECTNWALAFQTCRNLRNVSIKTIKNTTQNFGSTFINCSKLQSVYLDPNTTASGDTSSMFNNCGSLLNITLPANLMSNNFSSMFSGCYNLKTCVLPTSALNVTTFASMFTNCESLQEITLPSTTPSVAVPFNSCFQNCRSLSIVEIPSGYTLTNLNSTFNGCQSINEIRLPNNTQNSITSMASMCVNASSLEKITIPTSMTSLSTLANAFQNCYSLKEVTFPSSLNAVTTISATFQNCSSLQKVTIPTSMSSLSLANLANAFENCYALQSVILPTTITSNTTATATSMFANCFSLKSLSLWTTNQTNASAQGFISFISGCRSLTGITNLEYLASSGTTQGIVNATTFGTDARNMLSLDFYCRFSKLELQGTGTGTNLSKLNSLRLRNTGSAQYAGASPQINISYTDLSQAALVQVFNDLPTVTSKTINITSATGAAALTAGERAIATGKGWTITG